MRLLAASIASVVLPGVLVACGGDDGGRWKRGRHAPQGAAAPAGIRHRRAAGCRCRATEREVRGRERLGVGGLQQLHGRLPDRRLIARHRPDRVNQDGMSVARRHHRAASTSRHSRGSPPGAPRTTRSCCSTRTKPSSSATNERPGRALAGDGAPDRRRVREPDRRNGAHRDVRGRCDDQRIERMQHVQRGVHDRQGRDRDRRSVRYEEGMSRACGRHGAGDELPGPPRETASFRVDGPVLELST